MLQIQKFKLPELTLSHGLRGGNGRHNSTLYEIILKLDSVFASQP